MSNIEKNIYEIDQPELLISNNTILNPSIDACIFKLQESESGLTPQEELEFCNMVCFENPDSDICNFIIESDNQII